MHVSLQLVAAGSASTQIYALLNLKGVQTLALRPGLEVQVPIERCMAYSNVRIWVARLLDLCSSPGVLLRAPPWSSRVKGARAHSVRGRKA